MSDDPPRPPPPPPLRLKPRARLGEETAPPTNASPTGTNPAGEAGHPVAAPKPFFKPSLSAGLAAKGGADRPAGLPPPAISPPPAVPPIDAASSGMGKIQLKPKAAPPLFSPSDAERAPPVPAVTSAGLAPPATPLGPIVVPVRSNVAGAAVPHVKLATEVVNLEPPPAPTPSPTRKLPKTALIGIAAILVALGGFFVWRKFRPSPPVLERPGEAVAAAGAPISSASKNAAPAAIDPSAPAVPPAPESGANKASQPKIPGEAAANKASVQTAGNDARPRPVPATTSLAPGISTTTNVYAAAEANPAFLSFVANAKIGGVFQGEPPRIFINGRMVRGGEGVDAGLGIVFETIDAEKKQIVFKDKTGATVTRKY